MKEVDNSKDTLLRQKALALMKKKPPLTVSKLSEADALKLIHELDVQRIELEIQNEELIQAKKQVEIATEKYAELYDLHHRVILHFMKDVSTLSSTLMGQNCLRKTVGS